jgi:maltose phosphorylase
MNQDYIKPDNWSIIEEGFDVERVKSSESLFSIGNGAMGQRANFEENYTGKTFQGSYIAGIYYPDKLWKTVQNYLNAPNWIGIDIENQRKKCCSNQFSSSMKEGWYHRSLKLL